MLYDIDQQQQIIRNRTMNQSPFKEDKKKIKELSDLKSKVNKDNESILTKSKYDEYYPGGKSSYDPVLDQHIQRETCVKREQKKLEEAKQKKEKTQKQNQSASKVINSMTDRNPSPTKARLQQKLKQKNEAIISLEQQALYNKLKEDISAKYIYKKGTTIPSKTSKDKHHNETITNELTKLNEN
jgi:hypothetical protein